jgi:sortase A
VATSDVTRRLGVRLPVKLRGRGPDGGTTETRVAAKPVELPAAVAVARSMLIGLCALALWLVAFGLIFSRLQEHRTQHTLYADFREKLALQTARIGTDPNGRPIPTGEPVAVLNAPVAHISNLVVVEGTGAEQTRSGPGHERNTVLPGQAGASVLYGRSVTFGAPFAQIADLKPGDDIWAVTGQGRFQYQVEDVRRAGDPLPQPLRSGGSQLTLVTSESSGSWWRAGWAPTGAVYVDALLVKPVTAPSAPGALPAAAADEAPMDSDTSSMIVLVLWLQALLIAAVGVVWAWRRWGAWQTWIVGTVVMVALLWGASSSAALLLPNLV